MAFFGAIGTFITDSEIEYILTESNVLAAGSLTGFLKGKFYNRCTRINQIVANVMEKSLFEQFQNTLTDEELEVILSIQSRNEVVDAEIFQQLMDKYDEFFFGVLDGDLGSTAAFWGMYIYDK